MKWNKIVKDNKLLPDIMNTILGVVVIVLFLIAILTKPSNGLMAALMIVAGIMNLSSGYQRVRVNGKKGIGILFGILGFFIIIMGIFYLRLALA